MDSDSLPPPVSTHLEDLPNNQPSAPKLPVMILSQQDDPACKIFAFSPNRDTLGGTAYFIVGNGANILIDCPAWNEATQAFFKQFGGVDWLFITHRGGMGRVQEFQQALGCKVLVQEQEAYLLPGRSIVMFQNEFEIDAQTQVIWTPGHSPGSACLYTQAVGGVLFSGRHLLPNQQGQAVPLRTSKTFHWRRQLQSVQRLIDRFTPTTLAFICPGANTGFLRGKGAIAQAYAAIATLDLEEYATSKPLI